VIHAAAGLDGLHVIGRSSVFQYKGKAVDLRNIGERLQVHAVLEGSVRRQGDRLRVTAQLNNVRDGYLLWSRTWNAGMKDIFAVQQEIAGGIAQALRGTAKGLRPALPGTNNIQAYDSYLRGTVEYSKSRSVAQSEKALDFMRRAIALDPGFALPYTAIARISVHRNKYTDAKQYSLKAIALDESLSEAHEVYGLTLFHHSWDFPAAERELLKAIELNSSNPWAHVGYAYYLASAGRGDEAIRQSKLAQQADPLETWFNGVEALVRFQNGQLNDGVTAAYSALQKDPTQGPTIRALRVALLCLGRFDEFFSVTRRIGMLSPADLDAQENALRRGGSPGLYRSVLENFQRQQPVGNAGDDIHLGQTGTGKTMDKALLYCLLKDTGDCLDWLQRAVDERNPQVLFVRTHPAFELVHGDSRYKNIIRQIGFAGS